MPSVIDSLRNWMSSFSELRSAPHNPFETPTGEDALVYRLKHWPVLHETHKTAGVYRVLSVMSSRPVNRSFMLAQSRLPPHELESLLHNLKQERAIQVTDISEYPPDR